MYPTAAGSRKKTMQDPNAFWTIEAEENSINIF
jgi:hypothetical protein